jgi:hypothetical protein
VISWLAIRLAIGVVDYRLTILGVYPKYWQNVSIFPQMMTRKGAV